MQKTTVIFHAGDFDGLFCREIARKFLPEAELIGWDFADPPIPLHGYPADQQFYILDLPVDRVFGVKYPDLKAHEFINPRKANIRWIDHHVSAIASHPADISGYRIDGVAACRLAWQWFTRPKDDAAYPIIALEKQDFIDRKVSEPLAVRLVGEFDIWDKRDPKAELFQHGLNSQELDEMEWDWLLLDKGETTYVQQLLAQGKIVQYAKQKEDASIIKNQGFELRWGGLNFLALNSARCNSLSFTAGLKPEHDALLAFKWTGKKWMVSLYHAPGKEQHDLSQIAVKHHGGGHSGAAGFVCDTLPFKLTVPVGLS